MPAAKKRRRSTAGVSQPDLLSCLLDDLLINVLSQLPLLDAVRTCTLSRRWRRLWTRLPDLNFGESVGAAFLRGFLAGHDGPKIQSCYLELDYTRPADHALDSYLGYVMGLGVEVLGLKFRTYPLENWRWRPLYALPDCILRSETLKKLHLKSCELNLTGCVRLGSLTYLFLEDILLGDDTVERLTSCCPVLGVLVVADCNTDCDLKVYVKNPSVRTLALYDGGLRGTVELYVPHVLHLRFHYSLRLNYVVRSAAHCRSIEILYNALGIWCYEDHSHHSALMNLQCNARSKLTLEHVLIQRFPESELRGLPALASGVMSLQIDTRLSKFEIPELLHLFEDSPDLKNLVLNIQPSLIVSELFGKSRYDKDDFKGNKALARRFACRIDLSHPKDVICLDESECWEAIGSCFSGQQTGLKTLIINGFSRKEYVYQGVEDFLKVHEREIEFLKTVLRNSSSLELLKINVMLMDIGNRANQAKFVQELERMLLGFPKASLSAFIMVC